MVNLLSNDVNRFDRAFGFVHHLWIGPLQTLIVTGYLISEIGVWPAIVGIVSMLIYAPLQGKCESEKLSYVSLYHLSVYEIVNPCFPCSVLGQISIKTPAQGGTLHRRQSATDE